MGNRHDTEFIVDAIARIVERRGSDEARLAHGAQLRQQIQKAVQEGKPLDHYRYAWLASSATQLTDILQIMAQDFDKAHPDDMCSAQDLLDVLKIAYTRLSQAYALQVAQQKAEEGP